MDVEPGMLRKVRKMLDMTQRELANLSGVSQSLIAKIERGNVEPSYRVMREINLALGRKSDNVSTAEKIMNPDVLSFEEKTPLRDALSILLERGFSQAPVVKDGVHIGSISESSILSRIEEGSNIESLKVIDVMEDPFPLIPSSSDRRVVEGLLNHFPAVILSKDGRIAGIITKSDLLFDLVNQK